MLAYKLKCVQNLQYGQMVINFWGAMQILEEPSPPSPPFVPLSKFHQRIARKAKIIFVLNPVQNGLIFVNFEIEISIFK